MRIINKEYFISKILPYFLSQCPRGTQEKFDRVIADIEADMYSKGMHMENITDRGVYSVRLGIKVRLLLQLGTLNDGTKACRILTIAPDHDYAKALRRAANMRAENVVEVVEAELELTEPEPTDVVHELHFSGGKYIQFNKKQLKELDENITTGRCIVVGGAGSGKTTMCEAALIDALDADTDAKVLYVGPTRNLVRKVRDSVCINLSADEQNKLEFLTFEDLIYNYGAAANLLASNVHSDAGLMSWIEKYLTSNLFIDKRLKHNFTARIIAREFSVISGCSVQSAEITRAEYYSLGLRGSSILNAVDSAEIKELKKRYVFTAYNNYYNYLIQHNKWHQLFYEKLILKDGKAPEAPIYYKILIDEAQRLHPGIIRFVQSYIAIDKNIVISLDPNQDLEKGHSCIDSLIRATGMDRISVLEDCLRCPLKVQKAADVILAMQQYIIGAIDGFTKPRMQISNFTDIHESKLGNVYKGYQEEHAQIITKIAQKSPKVIIIVFEWDKLGVVKKKFSTENVYHISETAGLEYEDVVLIDPFERKNELSFLQDLCLLLKDFNYGPVTEDKICRGARTAATENADVVIFLREILLAIERSTGNVHLHQRQFDNKALNDKVKWFMNFFEVPKIVPLNSRSSSSVVTSAVAALPTTPLFDTQDCLNHFYECLERENLLEANEVMEAHLKNLATEVWLKEYYTAIYREKTLISDYLSANVLPKRGINWSAEFYEQQRYAQHKICNHIQAKYLGGQNVVAKQPVAQKADSPKPSPGVSPLKTPEKVKPPKPPKPLACITQMADQITRFVYDIEFVTQRNIFVEIFSIEPKLLTTECVKLRNISIDQNFNQSKNIFLNEVVDKCHESMWSLILGNFEINQIVEACDNRAKKFKVLKVVVTIATHLHAMQDIRCLQKKLFIYISTSDVHEWLKAMAYDPMDELSGMIHIELWESYLVNVWQDSISWNHVNPALLRGKVYNFLFAENAKGCSIFYRILHLLLINGSQDDNLIYKQAFNIVNTLYYSDVELFNSKFYALSTCGMLVGQYFATISGLMDKLDLKPEYKMQWLSLEQRFGAIDPKLFVEALSHIVAEQETGEPTNALTYVMSTDYWNTRENIGSVFLNKENLNFMFNKIKQLSVGHVGYKTFINCMLADNCAYKTATSFIVDNFSELLKIAQRTSEQDIAARNLFVGALLRESKKNDVDDNDATVVWMGRELGKPFGEGPSVLDFLVKEHTRDPGNSRLYRCHAWLYSHLQLMCIESTNPAVIEACRYIEEIFNPILKTDPEVVDASDLIESIAEVRSTPLPFMLSGFQRTIAIDILATSDRSTPMARSISETARSISEKVVLPMKIKP